MPSKRTLIRMVLTIVMFFLAMNAASLMYADVSSHSSSPENMYTNDVHAVNMVYNITLLMGDWAGSPLSKRLKGLNVSIYDSNNSLILDGIVNDGRLEARLEKGSYTVVVRVDGRVVGCQEINVSKSETIIIRLRAYPLKIICIDQDENYVSGAIVLLHYLAGSGEDWRLMDLTKTDANGSAFFHEVWNGTYKVVVESGKILSEERLEVNEPKNVTLKCNRVTLKINVVTSMPSEYPLPNASVLLQDNAGRLIRRGYTNEEGFIQFNNIYVDNYTIYVDWLGTEVFSGTIDAGSTRNLKIRTSVFKVSLRVINPFGEPIPYSKIVISKIISRSPITIREVEADKNGFTTFFLPSGTYEFSSMVGMYFGKISVNLFDNYSGVIQCNIHSNVWILLFLLSLPLLLLSLILERNRLKKPLEYRRYQNMLSKLESMYSSGLVEYKIYRKLKEEYETKLIELSGRKRR
ncbi:MAG: carboxypeptidase-like regulatory domain-containing protein [Candidatus Bathyarchaeia archaeon]